MPSHDPGPNPYDWRRHRPQVEVARSGVGEVAADLRRGGSGVLLAGRGLGKSVFLRQLHGELEGHPEVRSVLLPAPPAELTVREMIRELARRLGVEAAPAGTHELIESWLERGGGRRLVLLYDEFDRYGRSAASPVDPPGRDFFNNLELTRRDFPELGILAAGSIGVFVFRDSFGSSLLARARRIRLQPFDGSEIEALAAPFAERGGPLSAEILEALQLATGGNPALVTYGFESLWAYENPDVGLIAEIYARFKHEYGEFLSDFQMAFADPSLSVAPQRMWELIQGSSGPIPRAELERACAAPKGVLRLDFADVLDLLEAAGLIRIVGSVRADPVTVVPVASILSLPQAPSSAMELRDRLRSDLSSLLGRLHASGADFFRPGSGGEGKRLVPESVFTTFLALGFELLGWQVEREAQIAAGRTDLSLSWNGTEELAVVELKIWGRRGFERSHRQVESYWSDRVAAGAVVMITDSEIGDWPATYRATCLAPLDLDAEPIVESASPIRARFEIESTTADGMAARVDHFLIRVPRGR